MYARKSSLLAGSLPLRSLALVVCAAAVAFVQTSAAQAQPSTWNGIYAGVHGGYAWGDTSIGDGGTDPALPGFGAFDCMGPAVPYCGTPMKLDPEGAFGGFQAGANWQSGAIVIGAEGDFGWMNIDENKLLNRPLGDQDIATIGYDWYATLTARLGYAVDHTLLYVKGGAAFAKVAITAADIDNGQITQNSFTQDSDVEKGWTIGGGFEHELTRNLSFKAEYLYMDFGSETSLSVLGDVYKRENELHTIKAGLNFRFLPL
jgi:outer membrane immunogenic protein